jgi:hypothetical protein
MYLYEKIDILLVRFKRLGFKDINSDLITIRVYIFIYIYRAVVDRERALGRYSAWEYLFSKLFAELPLDALVGATFGYILHYRGMLKSSNHVFAGVLALVSCVASSLGLAIGAVFPQGDTALAIGPCLMVIYVILGTFDFLTYAILAGLHYSCIRTIDSVTPFVVI